MPALAQGHVYDEPFSGDLSGDPSAPTLFAPLPGTTTIIATQQGNSFGRDIDYFAIDVPAGFELTSVVVADYQARTTVVQPSRPQRVTESWRPETGRSRRRSQGCAQRPSRRRSRAASSICARE